MLAPHEAAAKKTKRRTMLFGGGKSSDDAVHAAADVPQAWIVGHKGKVSYNLSPLLNGEPVSLYVNVGVLRAKT